jgi:hypothetical protein
MAVEQVPDSPMFRQNTAAFIHERVLDASVVSAHGPD